jgi:hypothetical protein
MTDIATLKAEALHELDQAYRASNGFGGVWAERTLLRGTVVHALIWRSTVDPGNRTELVAANNGSDLEAIALAVWKRLTVLRSRQNVIEFPAPLQESA